MCTMMDQRASPSISMMPRDLSSQSLQSGFSLTPGSPLEANSTGTAMEPSPSHSREAASVSWRKVPILPMEWSIASGHATWQESHPRSSWDRCIRMSWMRPSSMIETLTSPCGCPRWACLRIWFLTINRKRMSVMGSKRGCQVDRLQLNLAVKA